MVEDASMCKLSGGLLFRFKFLLFRLRDSFSPPVDTLVGMNLRPGSNVLDYGCGPGRYTVIAAEMVGVKGKVYALDLYPSAIDRVQKLAIEKGLKNIQTILSDSTTGLSNASVDFVLLHKLSYPEVALREIYRVLRPHGILYFNGHVIYIKAMK